MIDLIVQASNQKGKCAYGDNWKETDETELLAWIGLVLRAGLNHDRASMSRNRFKELVQCIRFDDMSTRATRKDGEQGRITPIHELWEKFIEACKKNYSAGPYVTIDELLLAFRGRCLFKVYMPSKPGKYGIKVWSMVDASNAYLLNAQIYKGKGPCGPERHQAKRVVKDLTTPILNSGRNIACGNFFTDFSLAVELLEKKLTILGTLRKNKRNDVGISKCHIIPAFSKA